MKRQRLKTILVATAITFSAILFAIPAPARAPGGCNPCFITFPVSVGTGTGQGHAWSQVFSHSTTGNGVNSISTYNSAIDSGYAWLNSASQAGLSAGTNVAGSASQELKAGFSVNAGSGFAAKSHMVQYWWAVTANNEGVGLGFSSLSCSGSHTASGSGWIELKGNVYDQTTNSDLLSSDAIATMLSFSISCGAPSYQESVSNWTAGSLFMNVTMVPTHTYWFVFYADIETQCTSDEYAGATTWVDMAQHGNSALSGGVTYWL